MKYQNYQATKKCAQLTNELLEKFQLSPTPINYSVFYIYVNAINIILTKQLNNLIDSNNINDLRINEYMMNTYPKSLN